MQSLRLVFYRLVGTTFAAVLVLAFTTGCNIPGADEDLTRDHTFTLEVHGGPPGPGYTDGEVVIPPPAIGPAPEREEYVKYGPQRYSITRLVASTTDSPPRLSRLSARSSPYSARCEAARCRK